MQGSANRNSTVSAAASSGSCRVPSPRPCCPTLVAFLSCQKVVEGHDPLKLFYPWSVCVPRELGGNWSESAHIPWRRTIRSFILLIRELALATEAEAPPGKPG